ncbi:MAG: AMP-binding protein [Prevotellaceae bacterium]|nr:AMP-binding protein [Candidatus Colivivens caballi]
MKNIEHNYITLFEQSIKANWEKEALTDYGGATIRYQDLAVKIEKLHILLECAGVQPGDKVALFNKNCSNWAVAFYGIITYGAVAVPILHEFKDEQARNIVKHSEAKVLFTSQKIELDDAEKKVSVIELDTFSPRTHHNSSLDNAAANINALFGKRFPKEFTKDDIHYFEADANDLAMINYTSGSTGKSKGVMIPFRAIWSNVQYVIDMIGDIISPRGTVLSMLPMAHMYGLTFELLSEMVLGMHVYFLTRVPSPTIILKAMSDVRPTFIVCVPLIIEKMVRKMIMPKLEDRRIKTLLRLPVISKKVRDSICKRMKEAFGGRYYEVIIGGAAFSHDVEMLLHKIGFNYTVGYGATECAPLVCYADWKEFKPGSCGKAIARMEVRIDSPDPENTVGEILCRGDNVMLGYFNNEEETRKTIDTDGWYHTGDLGVMDKDGFLYIRGRSKNMLLGPSGQNIYPEEIEDKLNAMQIIAESVVIQKDARLYGLVYPDPDEVKNTGLTPETLAETIEQVRRELNADLPAYEQLAGIKIMKEEFEKTPKKSIKRYLYFDETV